MVTHTYTVVSKRVGLHVRMHTQSCPMSSLTFSLTLGTVVLESLTIRIRVPSFKT